MGMVIAKKVLACTVEVEAVPQTVKNTKELFKESELFKMFKQKYPSFDEDISSVLNNKRDQAKSCVQDRVSLTKEAHTLWTMYLFFSFSQNVSAIPDVFADDLIVDKENLQELKRELISIIDKNSDISHGELLFQLINKDRINFDNDDDATTRYNSLSSTYLLSVFGITFHLNNEENTAMFSNLETCPFLEKTSILESKLEIAGDYDQLDHFFEHCFDESDNCFEAMCETIQKVKFYKTYSYEKCSIFNGLNGIRLDQETMEYFFDMFNRHNALLLWDYLKVKQINFDSSVPITTLNVEIDDLINKLIGEEALFADERTKTKDSVKHYRVIDIIQLLEPINVPLFLKYVPQDKEIFSLLSNYEVKDVLEQIKEHNQNIIDGNGNQRSSDYSMTSDDRLTAIKESSIFQNSGYTSKSHFEAFIGKFYPDKKEGVPSAITAQMNLESGGLTYKEFLTDQESGFVTKSKERVSHMKVEWEADHDLINTFLDQGFLTHSECQMMKISSKHPSQLLKQTGKARAIMSMFPGNIVMMHGHSQSQLVLFKVLKQLLQKEDVIQDGPLQVIMRHPDIYKLVGEDPTKIIEKILANTSPHYDNITIAEETNLKAALEKEANLVGAEIQINGVVYEVESDELIPSEYRLWTQNRRVLTLKDSGGNTAVLESVSQVFGLPEVSVTLGDAVSENILGSQDEISVTINKKIPASNFLLCGNVDAFNAYQGPSSEGYHHFVDRNFNAHSLSDILERFLEGLSLDVSEGSSLLSDIMKLIQDNEAKLGPVGSTTITLFNPTNALNHMYAAHTCSRQCHDHQEQTLLQILGSLRNIITQIADGDPEACRDSSGGLKGPSQMNNGVVSSLRAIAPGRSQITCSSMDSMEKARLRDVVGMIVERIVREYPVRFSESEPDVRADLEFAMSDLEMNDSEMNGLEMNDLEMNSFSGGAVHRSVDTFEKLSNIQRLYRILTKSQTDFLADNGKRLLDIEKRLFKFLSAPKDNFEVWDRVGYCKPFITADNVHMFSEAIQQKVIGHALDVIEQLAESKVDVCFGADADEHGGDEPLKTSFPDDLIQRSYLINAIKIIRKGIELGKTDPRINRTLTFSFKSKEVNIPYIDFLQLGIKFPELQKVIIEKQEIASIDLTTLFEFARLAEGKPETKQKEKELATAFAELPKTKFLNFEFQKNRVNVYICGGRCVEFHLDISTDIEAKLLKNIADKKLLPIWFQYHDRATSEIVKRNMQLVFVLKSLILLCTFYSYVFSHDNINKQLDLDLEYCEKWEVLCSKAVKFKSEIGGLTPYLWFQMYNTALLILSIVWENLSVERRCKGLLSFPLFGNKGIILLDLALTTLFFKLWLDKLEDIPNYNDYLDAPFADAQPIDEIPLTETTLNDIRMSVSHLSRDMAASFDDLINVTPFVYLIPYLKMGFFLMFLILEKIKEFCDKVAHKPEDYKVTLSRLEGQGVEGQGVDDTIISTPPG